MCEPAEPITDSGAVPHAGLHVPIAGSALQFAGARLSDMGGCAVGADPHITVDPGRTEAGAARAA